ncbi:hypothetical protein FACS189481_4590 [Clostridia bacterium]|nr:hypothetical protein FACS189481_4590 [Clostridia bacterium]
MKCKKLQKVLCMALAVASVSSTVVFAHPVDDALTNIVAVMKTLGDLVDEMQDSLVKGGTRSCAAGAKQKDWAATWAATWAALEKHVKFVLAAPRPEVRESGVALATVSMYDFGRRLRRAHQPLLGLVFMRDPHANETPLCTLEETLAAPLGTILRQKYGLVGSLAYAFHHIWTNRAAAADAVGIQDSERRSGADSCAGAAVCCCAGGLSSVASSGSSSEVECTRTTRPDSAPKPLECAAPTSKSGDPKDGKCSDEGQNAALAWCAWAVGKGPQPNPINDPSSVQVIAKVQAMVHGKKLPEEKK